jgi:hypothetical protein
MAHWSIGWLVRQKGSVSPLPRATRTRLLFVVAGALAVVLVAVLAYVIIVRFRPGCGGSMVLTSTHECVGIVESVDVVDERSRDVVGKILEQNRAVAASSDPYVKIVLLTPMTLSKTSGSATLPDQVQASLEGAYTALYRANTDPGASLGDPNLVKIQMVLASFGSRQEYSERLVNDIVGSGEPGHPVVAVVGLGSSFVGTEKTAEALAARHIPMVSAVATADTLDSSRYDGLYSVSPSNNDYVLALKKLLDAKLPGLSFGEGSGLVVADDNENDPYVRTLREAFLHHLGGYVAGREPQWFTGSTVQAAGAGRSASPAEECHGEGRLEHIVLP